MQSSNAPNKISLPFAASGTKNTIPVPSQQGVTPGAASFTDGFPPLTFTPLSAGGVPPSGADFNGVLNAITALQQWKSAGGQFPFDSTFATAIGGYPKGATVLKADGTGLWISTAENNSTNPDTGGSGWLGFSASSIQASSYNSAPDTGTLNALAVTLNPQPAALHPGMIVTVSGIIATNTGTSTLTIAGLGTYTINGQTGWGLNGGEIVRGSTMQFIVDANGSSFDIVSQFVGPMSLAQINALVINQGPIICSDNPGIYTWNGTSYTSTALPGIQTFAASGTFTVPAILKSGAKQAWVTVIGGGGGAGSMYAAGALGGGGGGGGGGGISEGYVNLSGVSTVAVTVGGGGVGAIATTSSNTTATGSTGGTSSFGAYMSATGGAGASNWSGGASGVGSGGNLNTGYGPGESAARNDATVNPQYRGGSGGGPGALVSGGATAGNNATLPGGGGSGGYASFAGGNGASGIVIVRW